MLDRSDLARVFVSGPPGPAGESAYQVWLSQGNVGSKKVFLDSLKAKDGRDGQPGAGTIVTRIAAVALLASTAVVSLDGVTCVPADPTDPAHFGKVIGLVAAPTAQGAFATAMTFGPLSGIAGEFTAGDALYIADGTGAVHKGGLSRIRPSAPGWFQAVGCALSASDVTFQLGGFASRQSEGAPDLAGSRVFFDRGAGTDSSDATEFVNGVLVTPAGGVAGSRLSDLASRVLSPYDFLAVSDAVIQPDKTATASRSAAANTILLQNYFNYCRDYRIPWVLPYGNWLVDAGIKAYGPGVAYGRILASNDGRVRPGTDQAWGAPFTVVPYPEDILEPPTLAQIKTWTGVKRGSTRIRGLNGRKDQYITVLTTDQWLVDRRDRDNTNPGATDVRYNPMYLGEGFLVTDDAGEIAYPLIEDWQTDTWTEENTTITAQRTREPIDVVLPDVVLIAPAFANAADLQGRRSGIQIQCCNVNARGGSVTNLVPSVPPLQGFSRSNCCNVVQIGATVFSLGSENTQYGFMQNLTCGIQDIKCSAYNCRRGWDCTRGKDSVIDGGIYPDGIGAHYITGVVIKNVLLISCRSSDNPAPLSFSGGDLTVENSNIVVPPGFGKAFQTRADIWKWIGKIHFKGNKFFFDAGDRDIVVFLNLQGPARTTAYNTGVVTEMFNSLIVDQTNQIRVGGTRSDGTPSNARLQLATIFNDWDDVQEKDQIVGGRIYLAPQVTFDNPAPLPGRTLPPDPTDMDAPPVVIGAGFPKCKINYVNFRRSIGGNYDMVVEGLPDLHVEILCDRAGPKAAGRVNLDVKGVRGQKLISTTYGGTRKTYIQTRETETVTFETPGFASGFLPVGDENPNRTYDETQPPAVYGGDVSTASATAPDGSKPTVSDLTKFFYSTPSNPAPEELQRRAASLQVKTDEDLISRSYSDRVTDSVNVISHGARPDCLSISIPIGAVAGSTTVQTPSGRFVASDVGKFVEITGAGAPTTPGGPATILSSTIAEILSPTSIRLANAAGSAITYNATAPVPVIYATDSRLGFLRAMSTAAVQGRGVYVPPRGEYYFSNSMNVPNGTRLFSDGSGAKLRCGAQYSIFSLVSRSDIQIERLTLIGRMDAPPGFNLAGVAACDQVVFRHCLFRNHKAAGLLFAVGTNRSGAEHCRFTELGFHKTVDDVSAGLAFNGTIGGLTRPEARARNYDNFLRHCLIEHAAGFFIQGQSGFQLIGNRNYARLRNGMSSNYYIASCDGVTGSGNVISVGPHGGHGFDIFLCRNVHIVANMLWFCGGSGINIGNTNHFNVVANICWDNWQSYNAGNTGNPVDNAADLEYGFYPSVSRAGIVLHGDTNIAVPADDPGFGPKIEHGVVAANTCYDTGASLAELAANPALKPKIQQYGLQVIAGTPIDWSTVRVDSSNNFSGNAIGEFSGNLTFTGTRSHRAPGQPLAAGASSDGMLFDADRADLAATRRALKWAIDQLYSFGVARDGPSALDGALFDFQFARGAYAGLALGDITAARNSTSTDLGAIDLGVASGAYTTFATNVLPASPGRGLSLYRDVIQYAANPTAPASHTTASLPVGTYVAWCLGVGNAVGSLAIAPGSATISASGTAVPGAPFRFNVTAAGTLAVTVTGTLIAIQIENSVDPTSFYPVTGGTGRDKDQAKVTGTPFNATKAATSLFILADFIPRMSETYGTNQYVFTINDGTTANRLSVFRQGTSLQFRCNVGGTNYALPDAVGVAPTDRVCKIGFAAGPGALWVVVNGTIYESLEAVARPTALPTALSQAIIGAAETGVTNQLNGLMQRLAAVPFIYPRERAQQMTRRSNGN
ncbi:MAG: hypothetical protein WAP03_22135 [Methylorubrum rhodinum]|uniref:hypothetical protein n=1 Tax=Methylorubrum rhodinum TaxID=29428 RepID=UPI003BAF6F5D